MDTPHEKALEVVVDKSIFALLIILILSLPIVLLTCMYFFKKIWANQAYEIKRISCSKYL